MASFRAWAESETGRRLSDGVAAYRWMNEVFEPFVASVPADLAGRLEPAEAYHQYLEHRWFLSERWGRPVPDGTAMASFVEHVLRPRPEERVVLPDITTEMSLAAIDAALRSSDARSATPGREREDNGSTLDSRPAGVE
jgi:hypothetical protein